MLLIQKQEVRFLEEVKSLGNKKVRVELQMAHTFTNLADMEVLLMAQEMTKTTQEK